MPRPPELTLRRSADRFVTTSPGVLTRHCFSFGAHYDPAHVAHGPLVVCDEHELEAGAGFAPHPHRDLEIVTWVLEGTLLHEAGSGPVRVPAGTVQRMSAGSGVTHAERAADGPVRFVQMWLTPDQPGRAPSYEQVLVSPDRLAASLVPVVSGLGHPGAAGLGASAALHAGGLAPGQRRVLPDAPLVHLFVARGVVEVGSVVLEQGDSARLTGAGSCELRATAPAEVLAWEMHPMHAGTGAGVPRRESG